MRVSFNVSGLSGVVLGGCFKKTNWLQHRAKQHSLVRLGFLAVDSRAAMRCILTGGHGFSHQRVLYLQRRLDEGERLFSQRRYGKCFFGHDFKVYLCAQKIKVYGYFII